MGLNDQPGNQWIALEHELDSVKSMIKLVDSKVDSSTELTKASVEALARIIDERWRSMEQRFDMGTRQQQQSLELLAASQNRQDTKLAKLDEYLSSTASSQKVMQSEFQDWKAKIVEMQSNVTWLWRTIVAAVIAAGVGLVISQRVSG